MTQLTARVGFFAKTTTKFFILLGAVWLGGLAWFHGHMLLRPAPASVYTGGIVVLTGGQNRLETGLDLLRARAADRMLISGVHPDTYLDDISKRLGKDLGDMSPQIDLGKAALDTMGNANESLAWARAHHFRSLRLVTANYHMPRAMVEFRRAMPGIHLLPHPVLPYAQSTPAFALRPLTFGFIVLEFHKYLFSLIRARLSGDLAGDVGLSGDFGAFPQSILPVDLPAAGWLDI